jgi:TATA-binding protein-associated factor Taf7
MRRPLAIAAAAGTLAIAGGTAIAAAGGAPLDGVFGGDRQEHEAEFARDLASRLDGVNADQVERALDDLRRDKQSEHRKAEAKALAAELDGVSAADVEKALRKVEAKFERSRERGEWGRRAGGDFVATLAKELGKTQREIRRAFRAAHQKRFESMLDEAVKEGRLTEQQADRIRERMKSGPGMFGDGRRGFRGHHGPGGPGGFGGPDGPPPGFR